MARIVGFVYSLLVPVLIGAIVWEGTAHNYYLAWATALAVIYLRGK